MPGSQTGVPLRRDHQGDAVAQLPHRGVQGLARLRVVLAVNERHVGEPEHQPETWVFASSFFGDTGEATAQQLGQISTS